MGTCVLITEVNSSGTTSWVGALLCQATENIVYYDAKGKLKKKPQPYKSVLC